MAGESTITNLSKGNPKMQMRSVYSELRDIFPLLPFKKAGLISVILSITTLVVGFVRWLSCGYSCHFFPAYDWPSVLEMMLISLVVFFISLTVLLFTVLWISILKRNSEQVPSTQSLDAPAIVSCERLDARHWACLSLIALGVGKIWLTGILGSIVTIGAYYLIKPKLSGWRSVAASGVIGIVTAVVLLYIKIN